MTKYFGKTMVLHIFLAGFLSGCLESDSLDQAGKAFVDKGPKQVFFGDLHVHTNASFDAFALQIWRGVDNNVAAACDYARVCSQLDFWGSSDHAEGLWVSDDPKIGDKWASVVEMVRECNAIGEENMDAEGNAEFVVFQGFEWTSSGIADTVPDKWGHKNVFFANDTVPERPIASWNLADVPLLTPEIVAGLVDEFALLDPGRADAVLEEIGPKLVGAFPTCAEDDPQDGSCSTVANEPKDLWAKLNAYKEDKNMVDNGYDVLAIPHGTAWGSQAVDADWEKQLSSEQYEPDIQIIAEVYSGHGNSEEYRDFSDPDSDYVICAEAAKTITQRECLKAGKSAATCESEADDAYGSGMVDYTQGYYASREDWGLCNQCPNCFQPAENYQPDGSIQSAMARSGFDEIGDPVNRFYWGFIGATDGHTGTPGDVKEVKNQSDIPTNTSLFFEDPVTNTTANPFSDGRDRVEGERIASFLYPGGLAGVHASTRSRKSIWSALKRREVYGTSGPRMMVWFYGETGKGEVPMGGQMDVSGTEPKFRLEAWGAPEEVSGCSEHTRENWGDVVEDVCHNECYNPGDQRVGIDRVEVIKITPQNTKDEQLKQLIEDPWLILTNENKDADGGPSAIFEATFSDSRYLADARDAIYYIRILQEPTLAVNGTPMKNVEGELRACTSDKDDQCSSFNQERAWSSPIYVNFR